MVNESVIRNKDKGFDGVMERQDFRHKYMDSCGEVIVPSGIKTGALIVLWKGKIERSGAHCNVTRHSGSVNHTAEDD